MVAHALLCYTWTLLCVGSQLNFFALWRDKLYTIFYQNGFVVQMQPQSWFSMACEYKLAWRNKNKSVQVNCKELCWAPPLLTWKLWKTHANVYMWQGIACWLLVYHTKCRLFCNNESCQDCLSTDENDLLKYKSCFAEDCRLWQNHAKCHLTFICKQECTNSVRCKLGELCVRQLYNGSISCN